MGEGYEAVRFFFVLSNTLPLPVVMCLLFVCSYNILEYRTYDNYLYQLGPVTL